MTSVDEATTAALTASRALLAVVARSIAPELDRITVPQFRVLVLLSTAGGPMRNGELATAMGVHASTFTRTADRLVGAGWVSRTENPHNRRETLIELTEAGARLVASVTGRRREEMRRILASLDEDERELVLRAMNAFARAAGEPAAEDLSALAL